MGGPAAGGQCVQRERFLGLQNWKDIRSQRRIVEGARLVEKMMNFFFLIGG